MSTWNEAGYSDSTLGVVVHPGTVEETLALIGELAGREDVRGPHPSELRSLVRLLCVFARQDGLRAEQLIPRFKRALADSADVQRLHVDERDDVRESMVEYLIKAYYSDAV